MKKNIVDLLLLISIAIIILSVGYYLTVKVDSSTIKLCDDKYGIGNYTWVETTGTKDAPRFFIGQSWKCIYNGTK